MEKDTRPRYRGVCPVCGKENWICKSILMDLGINSGTGSCLGCGEYMHITFNPSMVNKGGSPNHVCWNVV